MIRTYDCQAERLSDNALLSLLIQTATEARRRPALTCSLRRFHSGCPGLAGEARDHLSPDDGEVLDRLISAAAEAHSRAHLAPALELFHREELEEMNAESLCRAGAADLNPDEIIALSRIEAARSVGFAVPNLEIYEAL